jgi:hypothetical protein
MPSTKQILEIYQDSYVDSIKRNMEVIAQELSKKKKDYLTPTNVEKLASHGLGIKVIASLYGEVSTDITQDPILMLAYEKGRSNIASQVRASIIDDALNKDSLTAKLHLDKVFNKEDHTQDINLTVSQRPLENISDEQLLQIDLDDTNE